MATKSGRAVKLHTVYRNSKGEKLVTATGAISILAKNALIHWAWDLGVQGIDYRTYRDDKAEIGTLTHDMVFAHNKGTAVDTTGYTQDQIDLAETCFLKYLEWEDKNPFEPILLETPLVSEKYQYGGTPDNYCLKDGLHTLIDYKTGKAIYDEYFYQLAGYKQLLEENGYPVDRCIVLRIGRDEQEGFEVKEITDLERETKIFNLCVELYYLIKNKNGGK